MSRILLFPGQGTQYIGMARPWIEAFSEARHFFNEVDEILGFSLQKIMNYGPSKVLDQSENAQPAILATSYCIIEILRKHFGINMKDYFTYTMGHSLGEYTSLVFAGVFSLPTAIRLVRKRGEWMKSVECHESQVIAVMQERSILDTLIQQLKIFQEKLPPGQIIALANDNTNTQIVLSGTKKTLNTFLTQFSLRNHSILRTIPLRVSVPVHSSLMNSVSNNLMDKLDTLSLSPPSVTVISNVTAQPYPTDLFLLKKLLARQTKETVQWFQSTQYVLKHVAPIQWVATGPKHVISRMLASQISVHYLFKLSSVKDILPLLNSLEKGIILNS
ncbi:hypothetical protein T552_02715 [Pneumocystis carinii B80]|uniref:[acyl-carrier-protein] S-malonyltransferase n=1 Tax=Pneumocystis carinii (strain B80) TaxID=1408658 RepID=A0A0W4ZEA9_PNEC8|nr:hypothetical protein T552_02715 [Pneumocystis carinii B80]KTW26709.1 hypothetical protein T552_02715 [Pneumocystis carinii B80]